jgi:hypothetical protein
MGDVKHPERGAEAKRLQRFAARGNAGPKPTGATFHLRVKLRGGGSGDSRSFSQAGVVFDLSVHSKFLRYV